MNVTSWAAGKTTGSPGDGGGVNTEQLAGAIDSGVAALGQTLPPAAIEKLARLVAGLERWNARVNLTSIRDSGAMVSAHVLDSLAVRPWLAGKIGRAHV